MASFQFISNSPISSAVRNSLVLVTLLWSCTALDPQKDNTLPISHKKFDELLRQYVNEQGLISYSGLLKDRAKLKNYLELLVSNPPNDKSWNREEKIAYWINLYNAFTLELILNYYPLESIKDIGSSVQVPFINTPWDIKFIEIEGEKYDLNNIEHNILRKVFDEPRIHFAINCASMSCPKLRREAYTGSRLENQLQEQTIDFLNDPLRNDIKADKVAVSKIFLWFKGDFTKKESLASFISNYSRVEIKEGQDINYMSYDWSLNDIVE